MRVSPESSGRVCSKLHSLLRKRIWLPGLALHWSNAYVGLRQGLPLGYSDLQRQAAEFKSGLPVMCLGPAGWPQSKVPAEATTVAPDGFCVVSDLFWREPKLLDFASAVQFGLIVVVRR